MRNVKIQVQAINGYAQLQVSSYSNVNLDFVLNTKSYNTNNNAIADGATSENDTATAASDGLAFLQCMPCNAAEMYQSGDARASLFAQLSSNQHATSGGTASQHISAEMKTHYFRIPGRFKLKKLEAVLDALLYSNESSIASSGSGSASKHVNTTASAEMKIFRMKGVVHIDETPVLHIVQAVHNIFDLQSSPYTAGGAGDLTQGESLFVIIGKNLLVDNIERELVSCTDVL